MADNSKAEDAPPSEPMDVSRCAGDKDKLADQVMQNPQALAALQERLDGTAHTPSSYIETLPRAVKRRIDALKQLQVKCAHIEARFYEEVHDLERKYAAFYQPLFDKGQLKSSVVITDQEPPAEEPNPKGIPEFWFTIFRNVDMLSELVQEYDEPILKHLQDIKVKFSEPGQPMAFMLEFHFEANDYFTNSVLTKTYKMKSEPDTTDPFSFEGPEIVDCEGCAIEWKRGKNVTVKTIKKKQKHKGRGTVRTVTKQVPSDSFFNFFSPIRASGDGEALDEDSEFTLATDFEIGHFFRERVVPRAVLYFTGEAIEDDENVRGPRGGRPRGPAGAGGAADRPLSARGAVLSAKPVLRRRRTGVGGRGGAPSGSLAAPWASARPRPRNGSPLASPPRGGRGRRGESGGGARRERSVRGVRRGPGPGGSPRGSRSVQSAYGAQSAAPSARESASRRSTATPPRPRRLSGPGGGERPTSVRINRRTDSRANALGERAKGAGQGDAEASGR
uniref:Nucleosome assembly protein 1 like 4 n=1 Tax=Ornithorhynchus anatinus TaxID=9258 RepID=A0A6I8NDV2_ORNAN